MGPFIIDLNPFIIHTSASPKKRKAEEVEVASNKKTKSKPDKQTSDVSSGTDEEEDNKKDPPRKQSISSKHLNLLCIGRTHLFNAQPIFITTTSIKCNLYIYSFQRLSAVFFCFHSNSQLTTKERLEENPKM